MSQEIMTQTPITVTYSLEEILSQINQKLDRLQQDVTDIKIEQAKESAEIKGDIKSLETAVNGISKRLDTQEFINRSVVVGFILAISAGAVKLFYPG